MKLNLGSGSKSIEGFVNVDRFASANTHVVFNLETTPWPWETGSIEEAHFIHSMEHMAGDTDTYLDIIKELYRVCRPGARVVIHVPHPRHDNFLGDPTHVRAVTPQSLTLFDKQKNDEWVAGGVSAATPLAHYIGVDFFIAKLTTVLDPVYHQKYATGQITLDELNRCARELNNVISEYHIEWVARK
jgi:predicted SAM-dependent methyltransferase